MGCGQSLTCRVRSFMGRGEVIEVNAGAGWRAKCSIVGPGPSCTVCAVYFTFILLDKYGYHVVQIRLDSLMIVTYAAHAPKVASGFTLAECFHDGSRGCLCYDPGEPDCRGDVCESCDLLYWRLPARS